MEYASELRRLKTELHETLARCSRRPSFSSPPPRRATSSPNTRSSPSTYSTYSGHRSHKLSFDSTPSSSPSSSSSSSWRTHQLVQELTEAAHQRRQLETQLADSLRREEELARRKQTSFPRRRATGKRPRDDSAGDRKENLPPRPPLQSAKTEHSPAFHLGSYDSKRHVRSRALKPLSSRKQESWMPGRPEAMQEVFSIQMQFADAMKKLERSVQAREELLKSPPKKRKTSGASSRQDTSATASESDESFLSFGSDKSFRLDRTSRHDRSPETPSTTLSSCPEPTESPSSDQKKEQETESSKHIRFSPVASPDVRRRFSFGSTSHSSCSSSSQETAPSVLQESSVSSQELRGESFLQSFEGFRRRLQDDRSVSSLWSSSSSGKSSVRPSPRAARELFVEEEEESKAQETETLDTSTQAQSQDSRQTCIDRRKQICLAIQEQSTQLVLSFGERDKAKSDAIKAALTDLRTQLRAVDQQLQTS